MGSLAGTLFSGLFSWLRGAFFWLWGVLFNGANGGLLGWMVENWKGLALGLLIVGTVIDLLVYLLRWRPDVVWASYFRRLRGEGVEVQPEQSLRRAEAATRHWLYADGSVVPAYDLEEEEEEGSLPEIGEAELAHLNYQPLPEEDTWSGEEEPETETPEPAARQMRRGLFRRVGQRFLEDLREEEDEDLKLRFHRLEVPTQASDAYQAPAYPPGWRMEEDDEDPT